MKYKKTVIGNFLSRPNRFIAYVEIDGKTEVCHVKNTGRCRELLTDGAGVILEESHNPLRKTKYDLIAVYKSENLINMDSQAPNKVFNEWLNKTDFFGDITLIKPEKTYKNSRFDFYVETVDKKIFIETKGVTLEKDGIVMFPDAPTDRGVKHLNELIDAKNNGYDAYVFFVVQMKKCTIFTPNYETHSEFAKALKKAKENGVGVFALNCDVEEHSLVIDDFIKVLL